MNTLPLFAASLVALAFAAPLPAAEMQADASAHNHAHAGKAAPGRLLSQGIVKKVDPAGGMLTIAHGPLENLGMGPMTMSFKVANPAWLKQLKSGDAIRFTAEQADGALTVSALEKQ